MKLPTLLQQTSVPVAEVIARDRLRPVSEAGVASLIASIGEVGVIKDAIHVRKKKDGKLVLMAGAHRLEAAKRLGFEVIEAKVWTDATDDWARMVEIDDNIAGAELSPLDTAVFLARRKEVYERLHPETRKGVAGGLARQGSANDIVSFAEATAEKFAMSRRNVERMVAAGAKLNADECRRLREAPRPVTLKDLAEVSKIGAATERYHVVAALAEGTARSAGEARKVWKAKQGGGETPVKSPVEAELGVLSSAWLRARKEARRRFVDDHAAELAALLSDIGEGEA